MGGNGWQNLYSQFNIAGGPIGIVAPVFADWQKTYWDNLKITYDLHGVSAIFRPDTLSSGGGWFRPSAQE